MTDSATHSASQRAIGDRITIAIEQLRQLTQINVQAGWHCCFTDLPTSEATQPQTWQNWTKATLNDRDHIAWAKGRQVLWLGQQLVVPVHSQGYPLQGLTLRLGLTWWAEAAQIFVNGKLVQEGDLFDCSARILLSPAVEAGETIALAIRLVSPNHDDGALVRSVCLYELASRQIQPCPEPGFVADELAVLQEYLTVFQPEKLEQLAEAIAQISWSEIEDRSAFDRSLTALRQQLYPFSDWIKQRCIQLLGHAHLDMAWLWPVSETWEAAERTFKSVLQLQQDFPELIFCHSSPALYAWIEANRPQLFAAIQSQIAAGRWEIVAGLWIEPEVNLVGGESIVRQVLYGQRYVQEKFGEVSPIAWLPDSFGFCWQLPQIFKQGGINYFVTQKLRWNDTTEFPYEAFWWQSPDGTQVFSLNSARIGESVDPLNMVRYACSWEAKTGSQTALWLPGVGDHGGGPTRDMLETARRWQQSPFFPRLSFSTALDFLEAFREQSDRKGTTNTADTDTLSSVAQSASSITKPIATWNDDLYLEFHRGCYTAHADQKQQNRRSEALLYEAELFASLATLTTQTAYPKAELETAWKQVLFNQFHDILPGSSIPEVYVEANRSWQAAEGTCQRVLDQALQTIASAITLPSPPHPEARAVIVFNALNWSRSEVVTVIAEDGVLIEGHDRLWQICGLNGETIEPQRHTLGESGENCRITFLAEDIPAVGYRCFWLCPHELSASTQQSTAHSTVLQEYTLENEFLRITVDSITGDLSNVFDKRHQREVLSGAGNQLQAFQDQGQYWDAWNIDPNYSDHPLPPSKLLSIEQELVQGTLDPYIKVSRSLGESVFCHRYILQQGSAVLKIATQVEWNDRHVVVKAAFPLNVTANYATYEIPYAAIQHATHPTSDREKAQWEVPALHWADLSDDSYGISLLSDYKHGFDSQPNQLRLTLLRGPEWPDPQADKGFHEFTYALYPHSGSWQVAQTVQRGHELSQPLRSLIIHPQERAQEKRSLPPVAQFLNLQANNLILSALKQSENNPDQWILRCYECCGETATLSWQDDLGLALTQYLDIATVQRTNLLEQPTAAAETDKAGANKREAIAPWQIASFVLSQVQV